MASGHKAPRLDASMSRKLSLLPKRFRISVPEFFPTLDFKAVALALYLASDLQFLCCV